jgi:hypothetical protein
LFRIKVLTKVGLLSRFPSQFSQKAMILVFFRRAGSCFGVIGDLMPKGDTQAGIGTG